MTQPSREVPRLQRQRADLFGTAYRGATYSFDWCHVNCTSYTTVGVSVRVTVDSSPHLRPVLHEAIGVAPPAGVAIDFSAAPYLDTSAIATLLEAATLASNRRVRLRVTVSAARRDSSRKPRS